MARVSPVRAYRFPARELAARLLPHGERPPAGHPLALLEGMPDVGPLLRQWAEQGTVERDKAPALYVVELHPVTSGILSPKRPASRYLICGTDGELQPLEEHDRGPNAPGANLIPTLAADDHGALRDLLAEAGQAGPPELEVRHGELMVRLCRLTSEALIARAQQLLAEAPLRPLEPMPAGRNLLAVLPMSDPGLRLKPIHRGLKGLETFKADRFLTLVADVARVYPLDHPLTTPSGMAAALERLGTMVSGQHGVLLALPGGEGRLLRFRQALELSQFKAVPRNPTLRSLDLTLLNALLLQTVLGVKEPDRVDHPNLEAVEDLSTLLERVAGGELQAGFVLNPPPLWEIRAVIEAQQMLPPRTMALEPLPPSGLLFLGEGD